MALATQAHLEKFLQIDVTAEPEAAVTMLLENATGIINSYVGRVLESTTYTAELYDPPEGAVLWLEQWPVDPAAAAPTVTENGTLLTVTTHYLVREPRGQILRVSGGRPRMWHQGGADSISITYTAGYDMTIDPLIEPEAVVARDVCTRIAARVFQAAAAFANAPTSASGIKTLTLEGSDSVTYADAVSGVGGVTLAAPQLTDDDKHALDPLRRRALASG
jgi:hypothetical protein